MALKNPNSGEAILPWAREATREIHSLRPTGGNGIDVTRTNGGTTISLKGGAITYPDSSPPVVAGPVTNQELSSASLSSGFKTTYSLERNEQNAFSLFGFSNLSARFDYHYENLSALDFVLRDISSQYTVLSAPTVRYWNFLDALSCWAGEKDDDDNGTPGQDALSVIPDSEILEPVTYSIQHNTLNEAELELYKFHDNDYLTQLDLEEQGITQFLIRHKGTRVDGSGQTVSCNYLEYVSLSNLLDTVISAVGDSSGLKQFHTEPMFDEDNDFQGIRLYIADLQNAVMINSVFIPRGGAGNLVLGWNNFANATALYLNIQYAQGGPGQLVSPTNIADANQGFVWNVTAQQPQQFVYSIKLCNYANDIFEILREGIVEVGALLPDSADGAPVGQGQFRTKSLEFTDANNGGPVDQQGKVSKSGLRLYGFAPQALNGGIGGNEPFSEWFASLLTDMPQLGPKNPDSLALLYRDLDDGNGGVNNEQGTLKYLPLDYLNNLIVADSDLFLFKAQGGWSKSIENLGDGYSLYGRGTRLHNFYNISGNNYVYPVIADIPTVSSYCDVVVRVRPPIIGNAPEVSYIPLSALPLSGGGGGYPLDGEEGDVGYSLDLNSEDEAEIYGFEDVENHRTDSIHSTRHDFILRYKAGSYRKPEVQYAKLSAVTAAISADLGLDDGLTTNVEYVVSSSYSTQTHKFINRIGQMTFTNGLLTRINDNFADREVFRAVEEEL